MTEQPICATRLRHTPWHPSHGDTNPDWNWIAKRWKTAEEYAGESLTIPDAFDKVACPRDDCLAFAGYACRDVRDRPMDGPHAERRVAAGQSMIADGWTMAELDKAT